MENGVNNLKFWRTRMHSIGGVCPVGCRPGGVYPGVCTPCEQNDWQTGVKNITFSQTSFAGGKTQSYSFFITVANDDYSQSACVLVWFLGHGHRYTIDTAKGTQPMLISHILSIFTKTKALSGKPKIFIFEVNFTEEISLTLFENQISKTFAF